MKFNNGNDNSEIIQIGDIGKNNISIDTSNINYIVTILSTSLYSNPIQSFIRETVSNAWDSHVEAGVTDPIVVEFNKTLEGEKYCKIKDFGVGLSEERFNTIYRNIGSSTRRHTNIFIGGFGIGRFSALAYTDTVYLTSVYNGTKFKYLMYKDGNSISIDLIHKIATDERNGFEVLVNIGYDEYDFKEAIKKQLLYFENLYIIDKLGTDYRTFNEACIKKYNHFSVSTLKQVGPANLLLGKVTYPLRLQNIDKKFEELKYHSITLNFDIGDLEVTPNREEILYTKKNIECIETKAEKALEELQKLYKTKYCKNYKNIEEFSEILKEGAIFVTLLEARNVIIRVTLFNFNNLEVKFNGKKYDLYKLKTLYHIAANRMFITSDYYCGNGSIRYKREANNVNNLLECKIADVSNLNEKTKLYIRETYPNTYLCNKKLNKFKPSYRRFLQLIKSKRIQCDAVHRKLVFECFVQKFNSIEEITNESVPKSWLDAYDKKLKEKKKNRQQPKSRQQGTINLYKIEDSTFYKKVKTESVTANLDTLEKHFKSLTVYSEKGDEELKTMYNIFGDNVTFVGVASTKLKLLKDIRNFISMEEFKKSTKYTYIRDLGTYMYILKTIPFLKEMLRVSNIDFISEKLSDILKAISNFKQKYTDLDYYLKEDSELYNGILKDAYEFCEQNNHFNLEIKGLIDGNLELLKNSKCILIFTEKRNYGSTPILEESKNILTDYILARKLFIPNPEAVQKLKKETIFNIKNDENN